MNKKVKSTLQGLLFILIIAAFIFIGTRDFSEKQVIDNEKFDSEYRNVDKDNVFVYANVQDIYLHLKSGSAVVFMGFPSNIWSGYYADILNKAAKEAGLNEILYYNFKEDRDTKNATYQSIVLKLANYVPTLDNGVRNLYAPTLVIVKNGNILYYDNETGIMNGNISPEAYWNSERVEVKMQNFKVMFQEYLKNDVVVN